MIPMHNTITLILKREMIDLPKAPAVYAIFSDSHCRFVGVTVNLQESLINHFKTGEPNVPLRDFMQSDLSKILLYEVFKYESTANWILKKQNWIELFDPADNHSEVPCR